jgi:hypothetical protein
MVHYNIKSPLHPLFTALTRLDVRHYKGPSDGLNFVSHLNTQDL